MDNEQFTQQQDERFVTVATKLLRTAAEQLARIAKKKGMTIYELIQMVCDTLIRYMDDRHNLSEEMERAMSIFEHMNGWADALNLADPTVQKEIAQAVYIFSEVESIDKKNRKKGFRAVMVNKPWIGDWYETSNVMDIFERVFNICMPELYLKLFRARIILGCERVSEVINMLCDAQVIMQLNDEYRREFEDAARMDNGKEYGYGKKTKGIQYRNPDSLADDQRYHQTHIEFDDADREIADYEAECWEGEWTEQREQSDARINYAESRRTSTEGQHRHTDEPPTDISDHD
jgi:hypothetical protein